MIPLLYDFGLLRLADGVDGPRCGLCELSRSLAVVVNAVGCALWRLLVPGLLVVIHGVDEHRDLCEVKAEAGGVDEGPEPLELAECELGRLRGVVAPAVPAALRGLRPNECA